MGASTKTTATIGRRWRITCPKSSAVRRRRAVELSGLALILAAGLGAALLLGFADQIVPPCCGA